jgi:hypothetical protein
MQQRSVDKDAILSILTFGDRIERARVCVMCARVYLDERVLSLFFLWNFERKDYFFFMRVSWFEQLTR